MGCSYVHVLFFYQIDMHKFSLSVYWNKYLKGLWQLAFVVEGIFLTMSNSDVLDEDVSPQKVVGLALPFESRCSGYAMFQQSYEVIIN